MERPAESLDARAHERQDDAHERVVLIFALFGGDAVVTQDLLRSSGYESLICANVADLTAAVLRGAGALVLAEEALAPPAAFALREALATQEPWSDLPIVVSAAETRGGRDGFRALESLGYLGNVALLERPVAMRAMVAAVHNALRARARQYETRDVLRTLADRESELAGHVAREREARAEVEAISRGKDEFLATVSHELRTPLNAMLGWARMLSSGRLNEATKRKAVDAIERNAVAQATLIEDLLDVSRIVSGKLSLAVGQVSLQKVVEAALETVSPAFQAKGLRATSAIDPAATRLIGDESRLQQVVWNLLSNAAKFTPKGGNVEIRVARVASHVELTVSDDGIGIDASFLPYVFQRFNQADGSTTRRNGGLGLGLAICRHLVELHGGTIEAASDGLGRGASFRVCLPVPALADSALPASDLQPAELRARPSIAPSALDGLTILVVDDNLDAREMLTSVLGTSGARCVEAGTVAEAVALYLSQKPDLVVSDIGMPEEDGFGLIAKIRALSPEHGGSRPALALTAYARAEDRRAALDAGFDAYLAKPVDPAELLTALGTLARAIHPESRSDEGPSGTREVLRPSASG